MIKMWEETSGYIIAAVLGSLEVIHGDAFTTRLKFCIKIRELEYHEVGFLPTFCSMTPARTKASRRLWRQTSMKPHKHRTIF